MRADRGGGGVGHGSVASAMARDAWQAHGLPTPDVRAYLPPIHLSTLHLDDTPASLYEPPTTVHVDPRIVGDTTVLWLTARAVLYRQAATATPWAMAEVIHETVARLYPEWVATALAQHLAEAGLPLDEVTS